jgi:putative ABC transport system ATP-binding protein
VTNTIPRLEVKHLTKRIPSGDRTLTILDRVDLAVESGESIAVLGPSGSGKSTLLALMAGLDRPSEGALLFEGKPLHDATEDQLAAWRRQHVGFVFQSFQLLPNMTALENVMLPLELNGRSDPRDRARSSLQQVGLAERVDHYPAQLSGGEQQRVALARALAHAPSLVMADEPTGNLDGATGRSVLDVMIALIRDAGASLVVVTHDPTVAAIADRRIYLRDGQIEREERDAPVAR